MVEQISDGKSHRNRKQQVYDLIVNRKTGDLMDLMAELCRQAYVAGHNNYQISEGIMDGRKNDGSSGQLSVKSNLFAKEKGLCQ